MAQLSTTSYWYFGKVARVQMVSDSKQPGMCLLYDTGCLMCNNGGWCGHKPDCPVQFDECAMVISHKHAPLKIRWDLWNAELRKLGVRP